MPKQSITEFINEPAFPDSVAVDSTPEGDVYRSKFPGMSRLEYFTALCANRPDPILSAKALLLELWAQKDKEFDQTKDYKS